MERIKLGIDVGGTNTKFALINDRKEIIKKAKIKSKLRNIEEYKKDVKETILNLTEKYWIDEINVSTTGVVNPQGLIIAGNIEEYNGFDWKDFIDKGFGQGVFRLALNDANAFAKYQLDSTKVKDFICITIGTGVGVSIVNNGVLQLGKDNIAGEIGSLIWKEEDTIDKYLSATNLNKRISKITNKDKFSFSELNNFHNWKEVQEVIGAYAHELAKMLSYIIALNNPSHIFLAGGISYAPQKFLDQIIKEIKHHFPKHLKHSTEITYAKEKNDSNILGLL
ncbi:MAG: ROK family protein [Mycoplasmatales bacterium]|nr:ROK family protein [Mycoplasmatales bacterium]